MNLSELVGRLDGLFRPAAFDEHDGWDMAFGPGEREALLDLLVGLDDAPWAAPTACAGWSVKDVALHLLGDDVGRLSGGRDGFPNPSIRAPGLDPSTWVGLVAAIDRQNAAWVEGTRRISPRLLVELLRFTAEATDAYFRELDLAAIGGPVDWAGPEPAPVWLEVAREYTERWVHQQHVRDAVGRPGVTERHWLAPLLATFAHALPRVLAGAPASPGAHVRLVVRGESGGAWLAERDTTGWRLVPDDGAPATAIATLDQDLAWRLFTRGVPPEAAAPRAEFAGDRALAARVLRMVSILAYQGTFRASGRGRRLDAVKLASSSGSTPRNRRPSGSQGPSVLSLAFAARGHQATTPPQ